MAAIELAPGASKNPLAVQMAALMGERLETHPERCGSFERLGGRVAIVAQDTGACLTMRFSDRRAVFFDGIVGIPDLTLRGPSALVQSITSAQGTGLRAREMASQVRRGQLQIHGLPGGFGLLTRLSLILAID